MDPRMTHKWLEKYDILDPAHKDELERDAAIHEFHGKLPRHEAEAKAHGDYVKKHRVAAASHHLSGIKAATGAGDQEAAHKHSTLYNLHVKALGHNPYDAPPPEVTHHAKTEPSKVYRFKPHHGDTYAIQDEEKKEEK